MKLFIDAHSFDNRNFEGVTTYIRGIYTNMTRSAPDIDFYFAACDTDNIARIFGEAPNIHYLKYKSGNKFVRLGKEIPALIKANKIDYAHFQYTLPLRKRCKEIVTIHDILFRDFPQYFSRKYRLVNNLLFGRSARRADILLTVSDYSRERIAHHYAPHKEIHVTPNGVSDDFCPPSGTVSGEYPEKFILYVSRIEPRKNHAALLKVFLDLKLWERGYYLVFIGKKALDVPELYELYDSIREDVRKYIIFRHDVSFDELKEWYGQASLFVYPSLAEGFGIPPLEAAKTGVACLCSNRTAMKDFSFFEDRHFDPENTDDLKTKVLDILNRPDDRQTKGTQKIVTEKYDWTDVAQKLYDIIKSREL